VAFSATPPGRPLLLRQATLGDFEAPGPRPLGPPDRLLRWVRPLLLPLSSVMAARTSEPVVALTYDDGPDPEQTPALLDVLADHGARATFFVLTDAAEAHPALVRRMLAEGHEVALHGIDHTRLSTRPAGEAMRRLQVGEQRLEAITGTAVRYYRPTYGDVPAPVFAAARLLGLAVVIWSAWGRDWEDVPEQVPAERVLRALHPGAVILLHDTTDDPEARAAGPLPAFSRAGVTGRVLDGLAVRGYQSVTVSELLGRYPAIRSVTMRRPRLPGRPG
jgi:peptidoglycan-N-acetylglucosamine deacetylase